MIDVRGVDFIDFGSKTGDSFPIGYRLGGKRGLGIDIRPHIVEQAVAKGFNVIQGDATDLAIPDKSVRFAVLNHFLEHLPSLEQVTTAMATAMRIATDCVYLAGPVFDDEEYLAALNLKTFWSDWKGHPCHLTCPQLVAILDSLNMKPSAYRIQQYAGFDDSKSEKIHPLSSPPDQHEYDPAIHPFKPYIKFERTLYSEWKCVISLNGDPRYYRLLAGSRKGALTRPFRRFWYSKVCHILSR